MAEAQLRRCARVFALAGLVCLIGYGAVQQIATVDESASWLDFQVASLDRLLSACAGMLLAAAIVCGLAWLLRPDGAWRRLRRGGPDTTPTRITPM